MQCPHSRKGLRRRGCSGLNFPATRAERPSILTQPVVFSSSHRKQSKTREPVKSCPSLSALFPFRLHMPSLGWSIEPHLARQANATPPPNCILSASTRLFRVSLSQTGFELKNLPPTHTHTHSPPTAELRICATMPGYINLIFKSFLFHSHSPVGGEMQPHSLFNPGLLSNFLRSMSWFYALEF